MEGITGALFRRTHRRFFPGVDRYFMPFVSPCKDRVFTKRELRDIVPDTIKRQLSCCHKMIWNVAILLCYMLNGCFDLGGWMGLSF